MDLTIGDAEARLISTMPREEFKAPLSKGGSDDRMAYYTKESLLLD